MQSDMDEYASLPPPLLLEWPEPIQWVQELAESGITSLPSLYIVNPTTTTSSKIGIDKDAPPVIDLMTMLEEGGGKMREKMMEDMGRGCREWGVFQVVNHGIPKEMMSSAMTTCRSFFELPMEEKLKYANDPVTYQGYGSRLGVQKGVTLDWNDYYFHHLHPLSPSNPLPKWPLRPPHYRKVIGEYGERVVELCKKLLRLFGEELGIGEECLLERFGGEEGLAACFRINYYPKCPQPELAIGLSPHTDPGIFTAIFQNDVSGLQVFKDGVWISVPPIPDALLFIIADQLEILSNGIYKSVNHRTTANGDKERMSMVVFFNPEGNKKIGPMDILVERCGGLRLYNDMTFNDHRKLIRTLGVRGKAILDSRSTTKDSVVS